MYNKIPKSIFQQILSLSFECNWLERYFDELTELLSFCENYDEINLISELIRKTEYLTSRERTEHWDRMAQHIIDCGFMT